MGYERYFLTDNPFPSKAIVVPSDPDIRKNGRIFNEELRRDHLEALRERIEKKINVVYVRALTYEKGVGKSALMCHEWRRLLKDPRVASIFLRPGPKNDPKDFCNMVIDQLHHDGFLWKALKKSLRVYTQKAPSPQITQEEVEVLLKPKVAPNVVDLSSYVFPPRILIDDVAKWVSQQSGEINYDVIRAFFESYLSTPLNFPRIYSKLRYDEIEVSYKSMLAFMRLVGFYCYIFLDQFEYVVARLSGSALSNFCNNMRRMLEVSAGKATFITSLHTEAHGRLARDARCSYFRSIAAPDTITMIPELERLSIEGAFKLALTYMSHFRNDFDPPNPCYPFKKEAITYVCEKCGGIPRDILEGFHRAIEEGKRLNFSPIDKNFIVKYEDRILPQRR